MEKSYANDYTDAIMPQYRSLFSTLILLLVCGVFLQSLAAESAGRLDLSTWDPTANPVIGLENGWQFVWQELLLPDDLINGSHDQFQTQMRTRPIKAAQRWTQDLDGFPVLPSAGYGSYYLKFRLPATHPPLALDLKPIGSAARVFWNGTEIARFGLPGTTPQTTKEIPRTAVVALPDSGEEATLLIQVANWSDNMPGLEAIPRLGVLTALQADRDRSIAITFLIAGLFLIMGLYHVCLYFFRRKDRSPILFAVICFLLSIRILVTDDIYAHVLFQIDDLRWIIGWSYLTFALLVLAFVFFITELFPFEINRPFRWAAIFINGIYCLIIAVMPPAFYTQYLWIFQIVSIVLGMGMLAVLLAALIQRRPSSGLFLTGFLCVLAVSIHDILKSNLQWPTPSLLPIGIVVFVFFQALVLAQKSTRAITIAENVSGHLQKVNGSMARFVPKEILVYLDCEDVTEIELGDHSLQNMTVLFADIRAFTRISESLSPEATFQLINHFLAIIGPIIRNHGGFVDKYMGDGIMALFPGDATKAVRAGLAMQQAMDRVNHDRVRLGLELIGIGVGIHHGPLMLGTIGEPQRMDSTVISDAVNLASRLQGLTRLLGGHVLVSEPTLAHIVPLESFQTRGLGKFKVYNRLETVTVMDFFDSEPREIWERKRQTRRNFERAVNFFQLNQLTEAKAAFESHLKIFPDDPAARYYLNQLVGQPLNHE